MGFGKINKTNGDGNLVVSESYEDVPEQCVFKGRKHSASAGDTTFFDIEITSEIRFKKCSYFINNVADVNDDDYIEMSIIDKDDVLGLFEENELTVGVDILEIIKFVKTEYICKVGDGAGQNSFGGDVYGAFPVVEGLFLRVAYNSYAESGAADINFITKTLWYE